MLNFFQKQPEEIKKEIFQYLSRLEQINILSRVCPDWNKVIKKQTSLISDEQKHKYARESIQIISDMQEEDSCNRNSREHFQRYIEKIKELLADGLDPNATNESFPPYNNKPQTRTSLLQGAVIVNSSVLAKMLLKKGANINYQNRIGLTPLHFAACYGNAEMAKLFIDHHANTSLVANDNRTAADWADMYGYDLLAYAIRNNKDWYALIGENEAKVSDEAMTESAFGQASNTAMRLSR